MPEGDMSAPVPCLRWPGAHLVIAALLVTGCKRGPPTDRYSEMPVAARSVLEQADQLEILLVDEQFSSDGGPVPNQVLRRTTIRDLAVRTRLIQALKKGVEDSHGWSKGCFHPRLYMLNPGFRAGRVTSASA
jgi:hypothetical protein